VIFLGAFLLFQVQLVLGKYILPWFGGTAGVWATCLLFFQLLLLAGYAYAHWLTSRFPAKMQTRLHSSLLLVSLAVMVVTAFTWRTPIMLASSWRPGSTALPVLSILSLLTISIGLPFLLLSATGPLIQRWFTYSHQGSPYRFYALSNLGSLLGLLSYPFALEPLLKLTTQGWIWSGLDLLYAAGVLVCGRTVKTGSDHAPVSSDKAASASSPALRQRLQWLTLAALGSLMLLAVTQAICQGVAVVPLLWVLPLAIYLGSFIICFDHARWYRRGWFHALLPALVLATMMTERHNTWSGMLHYTGWYLLVLFVCCMFCHGELYRLRPEPQHLTSFYLSVSLGGALGGVFVNLVVPFIFRGYWELQLGMLACLLMLVWMAIREKNSWAYIGGMWLAAALLLWGLWSAPYLLNPRYYNVSAYMSSWPARLLVAFAVATTVVALVNLHKSARSNGVQPTLASVMTLRVALSIVLLFVVGEMAWVAGSKYRRSLWSDRNFYGVLYVSKVTTVDPRFSGLELTHGRIRHGFQASMPAYRRAPTTYFGPDSGIGLTLLNHPRRRAENAADRTLRVGVIGLGTGTLAAYAQPGDLFRFYEINPAVIGLVAGDRPYFTFLQQSPARMEVIEGDGRISLERELQMGLPQRYDVLVVDAFTSDSIPVHLLTREAMEIYLKHLREPRSVLAFHISNQLLDLRPLTEQLAREFGLSRAYVKAPGLGVVLSENEWVLLSRSKEVLEQPAIAKAALAVQPRSVRLWTDDYSSLLQLFKPLYQ
jgi:spermidine synthase